MPQINEEEEDLQIQYQEEDLYRSNTSTTTRSNNDNDDKENHTILSPDEIVQIESCFSSLSTQVFVCGCPADLFICPTGRGSSGTGGEWEMIYKDGVPVVLLDRGEARSRTRRGIRILLAERGSSFALWTDKIDNLSSYKAVEPTWHTMCLSSDHSTLIGFKLKDSSSAAQLWSRLELLSSQPENISLSVPPPPSTSSREKHKNKHKHKQILLPPKSQISQPCCFQHLTSVRAKDKSRYFSLQTMIQDPPHAHAPSIQQPHTNTHTLQ